MDLTDAIEWVSLLLTIPTLFLCVAVLWMYGSEARIAARVIASGEIPSRTNLLILGIVIGFAGSFLDNLYWGAAWFAEAVNSPYRDALFDHGVWSNLPFRQGTGIIAGACHVWAAQRLGVSHDESEP